MTRYLAVADWIATVLGADDIYPESLEDVRSDRVEFALLAPQATLPDGSDLYCHPHLKAAVLLDELLASHAITHTSLHVSTSVVATLFFLSENGHDWRPEPEQLRYWIRQSTEGRVALRRLAQAIAPDCSCPTP